MLRRQYYSPGPAQPGHTLMLSKLGLVAPENDITVSRFQDNHSIRQSVYRDPLFILQAVECNLSEAGAYHTFQEDFIKINFMLSGNSTTVLDGFGECDHHGPEVFITAGRRDMLKVDLKNKGFYRWVALCVQRDFFSDYLHLESTMLPSGLRDLASKREPPFTARRLLLTPELAAAAYSIFRISSLARQNPVYAQGKAVELMYLLINRMRSGEASTTTSSITTRRVECLYHAREMLSQRYAEHWTLDRLSKTVGLSKTALTKGFRELFDSSVFGFLHRQRMQRACELLKHKNWTVIEVAQAVGYQHHCNFSTAFRQHFGVSPKELVFPKKL